MGYNVGFNGDFAPLNASAPQGTAACITSCTAALTANAGCPAAFITWTCNNNNGVMGTVPAAAVAPTATTFIAGAGSQLNTAAAMDGWTMDQNQKLSNTASGL
jgi:hypothetical protein